MTLKEFEKLHNLISINSYLGNSPYEMTYSYTVKELAKIYPKEKEKIKELGIKALRKYQKRKREQRAESYKGMAVIADENYTHINCPKCFEVTTKKGYGYSEGILINKKNEIVLCNKCNGSGNILRPDKTS